MLTHICGFTALRILKRKENFNYIVCLKAVKFFSGFALLERLYLQLCSIQFRQSSLVHKQYCSDLQRKLHKPPTAFEWVHFFGSFLVARQEMNNTPPPCKGRKRTISNFFRQKNPYLGRLQTFLKKIQKKLKKGVDIYVKLW